MDFKTYFLDPIMSTTMPELYLNDFVSDVFRLWTNAPFDYIEKDNLVEIKVVIPCLDKELLKLKIVSEENGDFLVIKYDPKVRDICQYKADLVWRVKKNWVVSEISGKYKDGVLTVSIPLVKKTEKPIVVEF